MAEIIINTKEVIKRKSYYPDFINIIINSKEFIIPTYKESASVDDIDNIQFEDICIRSEQIYITGECNVY